MQHLSRFVTVQSKPADDSADAGESGLRTKSGLVAGVSCEVSTLRPCTDKCDQDPQCMQKCVQESCNIL